MNIQWNWECQKALTEVDSPSLVRIGDGSGLAVVCSAMWRKSLGRDLAHS